MMNSPQQKFMFQLFAPRILVLLMCAGVFAVAVSAQKVDVDLLPPAAGDVDQCSNVPNAACDWQNGNLNPNNSSYTEGQSVPYRMVFDSVAPNSTNNTVVLGYDTTEGDKHTLDYLTSFNRSITGANPCLGVAGCDLNADFMEVPIPADTWINATSCPTCVQGGNFRMYNGTITGVGVINHTGPSNFSGTTKATIQITFTAGPAGDIPVLTWGGHISTRLNWGVLFSAINLSGSPYHMRRADGGSADRSMKIDAVIFPATITIIKEVIVNGVLTASTQPFTFTSSANFGNPDGTNDNMFTLVDNNVVGPDRIENDELAFFGAGNPVVIDEQTIAGWDLVNLACTHTDGGLGVGSHLTDLDAQNVTITLAEGEFVSCTFRNSFTSPSAAPASVTGRVFDANGAAIRGVRVSVTNGSTGEMRTVYTNTFGYYTFTDLEVGELYVITVAHKRYTFAENTRSFTLEEDLVGYDFHENF